MGKFCGRHVWKAPNPAGFRVVPEVRSLEAYTEEKTQEDLGVIYLLHSHFYSFNLSRQEIYEDAPIRSGFGIGLSKV